MRVLVLGSGVIGTASAYYLARQGFEVTVVDRQPAVAMETSFANAGQISPGYASPWAAPGVPLERIEEIICEELTRFGSQGPTAVEMEAVVAQNERAWLSQLASLDERADHISHAALLYDDPRAINTLLDRIGAVTADQVGEAAARWLAPSGRAVITYPGAGA